MCTRDRGGTRQSRYIINKSILATEQFILKKSWGVGGGGRQSEWKLMLGGIAFFYYIFFGKIENLK